MKQKRHIPLEMSCSASSNTGFVHFAGPIQPSELQAITVSSYFPLTFSFAPRTTIPTMIASNQIDENFGTTCIYQGKYYYMINVQVCSPLHKGFKLPGETQTPVAECILTYMPWPKEGLSGIVLCFPIYDSGTPVYDGYLDQIVNDTEISCGYENETGKAYEGEGQQTIKNSTLRQCIKSCCDDTQCLAYSFGGGTCHIKHTIPALLSTGDNTVSGKIKRGVAPTGCSASSPNALVSTLESMLYQPNGSTTHSIIAYKTCFETMKPSTQSLYVMVFPKGIRMRSASYQQLVLRANGTLPSYKVPPVIRDNEPTVLRYRMENGRKVATESSPQGEVYTTTVSTCTEEFQQRFEHFILPARKDTRQPSSSSSSSSSAVSTRLEENKSCLQRTTEQYKCVPFNEATDLNGNIVIPGNTTLEDVLKKQKESKESQDQAQTSVSLSTEAIEGIIGGSIGGIILLYAAYRGATYIFNRPT
jgi:hypothetical protein